MNTFDPGQRARRTGTALLLLLLSVLPALARGKSDAWANTQFSAAESLREALAAQPPAERSRHEYLHVINAYRRVYYGAPASPRADPSVVVVADLLAEMGRSFNSPGDLHAAIGQYKFLRREYPGSRDRFQALFNIARIYQDDLKDANQAKPVFEEFLRRYPRNHLADEARAELAQPAGSKAKAVTSVAGQPREGARSPKLDESDQNPKAAKNNRDIKNNKTSAANDDDTADDEAVTATAAHTKTESRDHGAKISRVTNIRHFTSQNYTRVAIDLEKDTTFESQRIENPERIFFDLQNTNLASSLLGKTFDVDDGLLKKIRVAQFQPGKSRIVLEVADHSDYDTLLLADPPRLIVNIHNGNIHDGNLHTGSAHNAHGDVDSQGSSSVADSAQRKPPAHTQPIQAASLKQAEPAEAGNSRAADTLAGAEPEATTSAEAKLPVTATSRSRIPVSASTAVPKKIIVEADDPDDDKTSTVAKLDPPLVKPATRPSPRNLSGKHKTAASYPDVREASPTADGDRSLIRALGLKIGKIVIDPGHGGHDTGTIGPNGLEEKDLVLDVGRRLGKLLQARMGADVVFTRKDDTFIPLETRTSIANQEQADLFVSIHANSSRDPDARGVETYYLNFTSSADALDVAARENAASDKSIHELQDLVKTIALKEKIEESREFAANVQRALHSGLAAKSPGIRDRGVKKAPFVVLIGANMPSILAEISFVSNPGDERRLRTSEYRQRIAESLYRGIAKYVGGLSGVKVAVKIDKSEGQ